MQIKILAIDNDKEKFEVAKKEWEKHNAQLFRVSSIEEAIEELAATDCYQLVVLFPQNLDYLAWISALRDASISPILIMSIKYAADEKIRALELGADEYMPIPDTVQESIASCLALLRRYTEFCPRAKWCSSMFATKEIFFCAEFRRVYVLGQEVALRKKEYQLLHIFMKNRNRLFHYKELYNTLYPDSFTGNEHNIIWNHISRLKKNMKMGDTIPDYIINQREEGYRFNLL